MNSLFAILMLVSLVCLPVSIINPKLFQFILKKNPTRKKAFFVFLGLIVLFSVLFEATYTSTSSKSSTNGDTKTSSSANNQTPTTKFIEKMNIVVANKIVKKVDGKYRYFFDIRNKDTKSFGGQVSIMLYSKQDAVIKGDFETTNAFIEPEIGRSVYIDANTAPIKIDSTNGIIKFQYTVKADSLVVKTGEGDITSEFEDLTTSALFNQKPKKLNAKVEITSQALLVTNNDDLEWNMCDYSIGSDISPEDFYELGILSSYAIIQPHQTMRVPWNQITKQDGTKFDYTTTQPKDLVIDCSAGEWSNN